MTVHELRKSGYKVRVLHYRNGKSMCFWEDDPKGGETVVQITTPDGRELEGCAKCSDKDLYNKKIGVKVAIGRALFSKVA